MASNDDIFEKIGSFGCYQISVSILLGLFSFLPAFQQLIGTFTAAEPPWQCVPNSTVCRLNGTFSQDSPKHDFEYRCHISRKEWEFTKPYTSVITEWDLVCSKAILGTFATSLVLLGVLPGNIIFGHMADKYGRKPALYISAYLGTFAALGSGFVPKYWMYAALRFITGMGVGGTMIIAPSLPLEFTGVKHRGTAMQLSQGIWSFYIMLLPLLAYYIRDWKMLNFVCAVCGLPLIITWCCIPESIRFNLLKRRTAKALKDVTKIARCNRKPLPTESDLASACVPMTMPKGQNICQLFRSWKLIRQTLILWFAWAVVSMVYYGVSLGSGQLGGSMYLDFFFSSCVEVPGYIAGCTLISRVPRKQFIIIGLIVAAISSAICSTVFPPEKTGTGMLAGRIITALLAKTTISPAFGFLYTYSAELHPTSIRILAVGTCSASARIGSFAAPYVLFLGQYWDVLPYGIMAIFSLVAGVLCLLLPETFMKPTKDVFEDESSSSGSTSSDESVIVNSDTKPIITAAQSEPVLS